MYLCDTHLHSIYSIDGESSISDICKAALDAGMQEIDITDHLDYYTGMTSESLLDGNNLYNELEEARDKYEGKLYVGSGVEVGQPYLAPEDYNMFLKRYRPDFVIGSVHNFEYNSDIYYKDFRKEDNAAVLTHYIDCMMELASEYDYDVHGHITYPVRYMLRDGIRLDLKPFYGLFRELFELIIEKGRGIELNVSGFYKEGHLPMPDLDLLKLYRECGGEILTIGSDAHNAGYVGVPIREGMELAKEAGFDYIAAFRQRKCIFHKI